MELPKGMGGLCIRNIRAYNMALLAKQAVRIPEKKEMLVSKILHSKYKLSPVTLGLQGKRVSCISWSFQGMCKAIYRCSRGIVIGNGSNTRIMGDKWIKGEPLRLKDGVCISNMNLKNVEDLMNNEKSNWNSS